MIILVGREVCVSCSYWYLKHLCNFYKLLLGRYQVRAPNEVDVEHEFESMCEHTEQDVYMKKQQKLTYGQLEKDDQ
jgi:hypothetical protein